MRRLAILLISMLILSFVVGAIGCDDEGENGTPTPTLSPTLTPTPTPTRTAEVQKAIEIAMKDPSVKEEISGKGYELGEVRPMEPDEPADFVVTIHIGKRELPGISLRVGVDVEQEKVLTVNRHLRPRQLAEEEKAEARRIALSDPEVLELIGDKEYEVTSIEELSWSRGGEFFVFPAVLLNIPPDMRVQGLELLVFVDPEAKKVVEIISSYRKPLPPMP